MSGPQCCSNPPTLNPASGAGHVEKLGGLDTYASGLPDSKLAVFLISDVFGYEAPNLRKLADKIAAAGFYAVVPDFFCGDPYAPEAGKPLLTWLEGHGADKGVEDAKPIIKALKSTGISAIGAVGFCWGAKVLVQLAKREVIQAAVLCHPAFVTVDDIKGVEVPIAVLGAEFDDYSPPSLLKQFEEVITANNEVDGYVKIFPKVEHGWIVRYDVGDKAAVKPAEEAHQNLLEWFAKSHILGAEIDHVVSTEQLKDFGEKLSAKAEFDSFVKIYLGVAHGWMVKYTDEDEFATSLEEAHEDMFNWFTKNVK